VQQTPTKILLANPSASWESYKKMQITEKEFAKVKSFIESQRLALIKQEESSAVIKMDLRSIDGPSFAEFLPILSGSADVIYRCQQLIEELGTEDPTAWLPILQNEIVAQRSGGAVPVRERVGA
jgi:type IV secretion system protein VirB4